MAKDAKGHGSEKRGGSSFLPGGRLPGERRDWDHPSAYPAHSAGVQAVGQSAPDINHPIYNTAQKVRGYSSQQTPLSADYNAAGGMLRQRMSDVSKEGHLAAGDNHIKQAAAMDAEHQRIVADQTRRLGGADPGPLISGIVSDKFSPAAKEQLRGLAHGSSDHTDAGFAHYAAAGIRLPTARARYQGLKGS